MLFRSAHFRPEFLNRLDEIIMFKPLTKENIRAIIDLLVADVNRRLEEKELTIELTEAVKDCIVEGGYDPMYGARPLKRYLQKNVETLAARLILAGNVGREDTILIDAKDGKLKADVKRVNSLERPIPHFSAERFLSRELPAISRPPFSVRLVFRPEKPKTLTERAAFY